MLALQAGLSIPTNFFLVTLHTFTMRRALLIRLSMHTNLLTRPSVELDSPVVLFRDDPLIAPHIQCISLGLTPTNLSSNHYR